MAMWAGVQNVSRPMVMCHEMSQISPTRMLVAPRTTAIRWSGRARAGAAVRLTLVLPWLTSEVAMCVWEAGGAMPQPTRPPARGSTLRVASDADPDGGM